MTSSISRSFSSPAMSPSALPASESIDTSSSTSTSSTSSTSLSTRSQPVYPLKEGFPAGYAFDRIYKVFLGTAGISGNRPLAVSFFGPFHVLAAHDAVYALSFVAHIDSYTNIQSLKSCLGILNLKAGGSWERNILPQLQWCLAGGWQDDSISRENGDSILSILASKGVPSERIDLSKYRSKSSRSEDLAQLDPELNPHAFFGAYMDPKEGILREFTKTWEEFEAEEERTSQARVDQAIDYELARSGATTASVDTRERIADTLRFPLTLKIVE